MNLLSRLFGKTAPEPKAPEPVLYKDCRIFADPMAEGSTFRIAARIEKDFDGATKVHQLIRADTRTSRDEASTASVDKAKVAIDQLGDTLFG